MTDDYIKEINSAIIVCDKDGRLLYLNDQAIKQFEKDGGRDLIGTNIIDCHTEPGRATFVDMLKNPVINLYTVERAGLKKLICQQPWYTYGEFKGYVEFVIPLPLNIKNKIKEEA